MFCKSQRRQNAKRPRAVARGHYKAIDTIRLIWTRLPDGTGLDLMEKLGSKRPRFGIALTGFGMEEDIRKTREAGFQHHLVKPIDLTKLDQLIQDSVSEVTQSS